MTYRAISLGAGVQSTTLALMAARGEIGPTPGEGAEYERGYEDACCDIDTAINNQKYDRRRKKRQAAIVKAA